MKQTLRVALLLLFTCAVTFSVGAHAQQVDFAFGLGTIEAPGASQADSNHSPVSLTGGAYPSFSGDVLLHKRIGFQAELAWKASRSLYPAGSVLIPFRPLFWDFNAIYAPKLASRAELELLGGIGAQSTRFYTGTTCGLFSCSNFQSINHFMGHFGAGVKLYAAHNFFVRPEAHLYLVNNNQEFSSARAVRYGISIGYTLR